MVAGNLICIGPDIEEAEPSLCGGAPRAVIPSGLPSLMSGPSRCILVSQNSPMCIRCLCRSFCRDCGAGWLPNWLRMAPWSLAFFLTFERLRSITGQSSFRKNTYPEVLVEIDDESLISRIHCIAGSTQHQSHYAPTAAGRPLALEASDVRTAPGFRAR